MPLRLDAFEDFLWKAGQLPDDVASNVRALTRLGGHPMATLQAITPLLTVEPPRNNPGRTTAREGGSPRGRPHSRRDRDDSCGARGREVIAYPWARRYGERYLYLLNNRAPTADELRAFDCMQILQLDHGFNASTFTARVVTSTLGPTASALSAAMGALFGSLHGGADQAALEMAIDLGAPEHAAEFVATLPRPASQSHGHGPSRISPRRPARERVESGWRRRSPSSRR